MPGGSNHRVPLFFLFRLFPHQWVNLINWAVVLHPLIHLTCAFRFDVLLPGVYFLRMLCDGFSIEIIFGVG
ncbi:uncharacterized protein BO96DRAFT_250499 [Aspergillus niger CBS 101883]|uniref:uncharacterized protein n=1 Tax=Aspergillus lacticoffeatus (strain CBS 101883) TaxID=1450533 RepID=UPI000D7F53F5|nr:uncharacterized protein BO96DRAFT_250499 [Aspergillus niger CBS 101883]PYH57928.1 hypothetical protein BO96DRAFT_250499 [Aspergillus niger CBS 101883]